MPPAPNFPYNHPKFPPQAEECAQSSMHVALQPPYNLIPTSWGLVTQLSAQGAAPKPIFGVGEAVLQRGAWLGTPRRGCPG